MDLQFNHSRLFRRANRQNDGRVDFRVNCLVFTGVAAKSVWNMNPVGANVLARADNDDRSGQQPLWPGRNFLLPKPRPT